MNDKVMQVLRHPATAPAVVGVVCFGLGYLLGRRNKIVAHTIPVDETDWEPVHQAETKVIVVEREFAESVPYVEEELTSQERIERGNAAMEAREAAEAAEALDAGIITGVQFAGIPSEDWDYDREVALRNEAEPYILHRDEFYTDELGFEQTTLTYYAGDDILSDQEDKPVYNHIHITGPLRFGHGSDGDPNIFYVRNHKLKAEYEICFDPGLYSEIVLGLEIEQNDRAQNLKHSHKIHKFRSDE